MWIPTTKLAPTELRIRRETKSCSLVSPSAKNSVGTAMSTIRIEKTRRGPNRSSAMPTMMRAGMVSATFAMANRRISSLVSQPTVLSMDDASGAMLNQT